MMNNKGMSLLEKISAQDEECGKLMKDNCITEDEDISELCYESLLEIIPGGGRMIIKRAKVWKIIQSCLKSEHQSPSSTSLNTSSGCPPGSSLTLSKCDLEASRLSLVEVKNPVHPRPSESPINNKIILDRPNYIIYSDAEVISGANSGKMTKDARHRLVRGTIHNMVSIASQSPFLRQPTTSELEEMAKSLVISYPCLRDAETCHGVLMKQLRRRLSNVQPVKKAQGPCPKKKRYNPPSEKDNAKIITEEPPQEIDSCMSSKEIELESSFSNNFDNDHDDADNSEMMQRHFKVIEREMQKRKPDVVTLNLYLNKEFNARRDWLKMVPAVKRCQELLETYPCFRDYVEVIEEARRVLFIDGGERLKFKDDCIQRLVEELDLLIYYGINEKGMSPPKSPKLDAKIIYLLKNLPMLFGRQKLPKKTVELIHELKQHEDPDSWSQKQNGNLPVLVYDRDSIYVIVGRRILFQMDSKRFASKIFAEATVGFLGAFYLLDYDYPKHWEIGMNMLQYFVFEDHNSPEDTSVPFNQVLKEYKKYKSEVQ